MTTLDTLRTLTQPGGLAPGPWQVARRPLGGTRVVDANSAPVADTAHDPISHFIAAAPTHLADLITALEQIERVREVHVEAENLRSGHLTIRKCANCGHPYPCPTIRILDGNE